MGLIEINRNPPLRHLNIFAIAWLVFFGAIGGIVFYQTRSLPVSGTLWALAVVVPALGAALPSFMRIVYVGMAYAAFPIGFVISHVILAVVYYLLLTPTGLLMRLVGYDPMHRRFDAETETYWIPRPQEEQDVARYFRQF